MSPEAIARLRRWIEHLPKDASSHVFAEAMNAWDQGKEPPVIPRPIVVAFSVEMERKLRFNDHKGGWQDDTLMALLGRLREETNELQVAIGGGSAEEVLDEAADIANFALMIADLSGMLKVKP